jgi:uncharacterized membrane protein
MGRRMAMAIMALVGCFIATYLVMHRLGMVGTLACAEGFSCETVQLSKWSSFLGLPVAAWGLGYYVTVLALSVIATQDRFAESRRLTLALLAVTGWGFLFSTWLTALEAFAIRAWCQWCVISAVLATVLFGLAVWDWREGRGKREEGGASEGGGGRREA